MDQNEQMPIAVLRVLIKQLISMPHALNDPIPTLVRSLYNKNCAPGTTPEIKALQDCLIACLALFKESFFVFDALDECREDLRKQLLSLIHWMSGSGTKIFLTSRPYHDISVSLNPSTPNSHVEKVELAAKEEDVIIYVQKTIQDHDDAGCLIKDDLRLKVISKLVNACKGMFLLVDFYIKDLCEYTTVGGVQNALDGIGSAIGTEKALHDTYGKVMDSIRAQHKSRSRLALKVLTWLLTAYRTLPVNELRMAVAMGDEGQVGNPKPFNEAEMPGKSLILTVCRGLVMDDQNSNTIKFVHYSVHEYLEKTSALGDLASRHLTVAFGCLEHLWFSYIEPHPRRHFLLDDGWLVEYARRNLHTHIQASHHIAPIEPLLRFLRSPGLVRYLGVLQYTTYFMGMSFPVRDNHRAYGPLREATAWGSTILIKCLLEEGTDPHDPETDTPLHIAAGENRVDVVQFWLGKGVDINATDRGGKTPLAYAIRLRSIDAGRELLISGADVKAVLQARGWEHYEARDPNMLELLFEFGLSVEEEFEIESLVGTRTERYLIHAIKNDDADVVELLLRKGASIHACCSWGRTPLHWAAAQWVDRTDIVRLLLQHGYG
ncbi:ankyrin repeat-containing domain protein, partial [Morchella snyderi]